MATYKLVTDNKNTYFTNNKIAIGTAAPTSGTHAKGDLVLSSSANSTAFGWICTAAGTPGTWKVLKSGGDVTSVSGNAGTATKFASSQTVALTGDVTGSASSTAGWSVATTLANSGVTAGSYGPSAAASPAHGGTFSVPYITVDAKGRVTSASTKTITLPSDNNTDTKVTNTLATTTKFYLTGTSSSSTNTGTQYFDTGIYTTTTAGELVVGSLQTTKSYDGTTSYTSTPLGLSYFQTADTDNGSVSAYSTTLTVNQSANRQFQICANNGGSTLAFRSAHVNNTGGTGTGWSTWQTIYHTGNKPTYSDVGAAASSHTHSYAGSASAGGAANSVKTNLVVKLNGGATENTNLFTFNGSTTKTINITPSAIGAAASSHGTHVTFSTTAPKANGTAAVGTATTVSRSDHVHPLQTTVSGNAGTATKLATARTLTIGSTGKTFDGSGNVTWTLSEIGAAASSHSHNVLTTKGTNTITSTSSDTTANWGAQGHSIHWYSATGQLIDQPNQWGYILNLGNGSEVHQIWLTQASGDMLHRGGNSSGWSGTWRKVLDSSNYSGYAVPLSGGTMTGVLTTPNLVTQGISLKGANGNDTEAHPFVFYDDTGSGWFVPADKPGFHVGDQGCGLYFCGSNISFCYFSDDTTISSINDEDGVEAMCSPDNIGKRKPDAIYNVYHEGFNPTPEAVGALSIEGGTVTGETTFESVVTADTIYSTNAINISSDRNLKEDIKYISPSNVNLLNEENNSDNISLKDMYDFVKDELGLASYTMKNDKESKKKINFIAQDLLYNNNEDSKVGQLIVNAEHAVNNDTTLSYDLGNYNSIIAGALQYAIKEIENLKAEIEELKSK